MATIAALVPRKPHVAVSLRLPPELHARLTAAAEREHRSLTAQIIHFAEEGLARQERAREREQLEREGQPPGSG